MMDKEIGERVWFILFDFDDSDHFTNIESGIVLKKYGDLCLIGFRGKQKWLWKKRLFQSEKEMCYHYDFNQEWIL